MLFVAVFPGYNQCWPGWFMVLYPGAPEGSTGNGSDFKSSQATGPRLKVSRKVRKSAKIRNRYNQAPYLTQDTNGKVTTSQLDITNESQEVSPFPAGDHRHQQTDVHESLTKQDINNINDPQKKHRLVTVSKNIFLEGLNRFNGAPTSPLVQMWMNTQS